MAFDAGIQTEKQRIKLKKIKEALNQEDFKVVEQNTNDGRVEIAVLPGNIYVVPTFSPPSHDNPLQYVHIRDEKCPLEICKEKRSKLRLLLKKDPPLCIHTVLAALAAKSTSVPVPERSISAPGSSTSSSQIRSFSTPAISSSSESKIRYPKVNRDLTINIVIQSICEHFPTLTKLETETFVSQSRNFLEKLVSSERRNEMISQHIRKSCTSCHNSVLEKWPFEPKKAYFLRDTFLFVVLGGRG